MNARAQTPGFSLIVGLVLVFVIGIMFIVFNQAYQTELIPVAQNLIGNDSTFDNATKQDSLDGIDRYNSYWKFIPVFVFIMIMGFIILNAIRGS